MLKAMTLRSGLITSGLLALAMLGGCALPAPEAEGEQILTTAVPGRPVTIQHLESEKPWMPLIISGIDDGLAAAGRWGALRSPIVVVVYPTDVELQRAIRKEELRYLKAWATDRDLALVSPRKLGPRTESFRQLLVHELTHVVHYQTAAIPAKFTKWKDPLWFREGLAIWTAEQASWYPDDAQVRRFLDQHRDFDPLGVPERYLEAQQPMVYATAYSMVAALIREQGEDAIRRFLATLATASSFDAAFETAFGRSPVAFRDAWRAALPG
jgi:hypothetical protein